MVEGETPYCLIEHGYRLLPTVPGMLEGGVTTNGGRPSVNVMVEAVADVDLNSYPPFMQFAQWPDDIGVDYGSPVETLP